MDIFSLSAPIHLTSQIAQFMVDGPWLCGRWKDKDDFYDNDLTQNAHYTAPSSSCIASEPDT